MAPAGPDGPAPNATKAPTSAPKSKSFTVADADRLLAEVKGLETSTMAYKKLEEEAHAAETSALKDLERLQTEYRALLRVLRTKRKETKREVNRRSIAGIPPGLGPTSTSGYFDPSNGTTEVENADKLNVGGNQEDIVETELWLRAEELKRHLDQISRDLPQKPGLVLLTALGSPTPARIRPHSARLAYKRSYEAFKLNFTVTSGVFALANLLFTTTEADTAGRWFFVFEAYKAMDLAYLFLLLYYYSVMALREHVLVVNGSRIRAWWLMHHVVTVGLIGTLLVWPDNDLYKSFRPNFMLYGAYLGVVSYAQHRYQTQRLYSLRALGLAGPMDTAAGIGAAPSAGRDFGALMWLLIGGQFWQVYCGALALWLYVRSPGGTWHTAATGVLFMGLGLANFYTTVQTFLEKTRSDRRLLLSRERERERGRHMEMVKERERSKSRGEYDAKVARGFGFTGLEGR